MAAADKDLAFQIYSHADADGGIAAAIFGRHMLSHFGQFGWRMEYTPVNHGTVQDDWPTREIKWPCAILDFTLHPAMLSDRFHSRRNAVVAKLKDEAKVPRCTWIDHHPTGSSYPFLNDQNARQILPNVLTKWDCTAISTPGLLRTHHEELGISRELIGEYEDYIDLAEIIDGALYASAESAHDYSSDAIKLQTLFSSSHPCINRDSLFRKLVAQIESDSRVENLFDSDPIFWGVIQYEQGLYARQMRLYERHSALKGNVVVANFIKVPDHEGMGRFIPYLLYPEAQYAIHVIPKKQGMATISCGINPWNKPNADGDGSKAKHLGNYFADHFGGGGHAFVAGGKLSLTDEHLIEQLAEFVRS